MLDFSKMSQEEKSKLLKVFEKHGKISMPNILEQIEIKNIERMELDKIFLRLLGMAKEDINGFLERLYSILGRELHKRSGVVSD